MGCKYTFKGKNLSKEELINEMLNGMSDNYFISGAEAIKQYLGSDVNLTPEMQAFFDEQIIGEQSTDGSTNQVKEALGNIQKENVQAFNELQEMLNNQRKRDEKTNCVTSKK